MVPEVTSIRVHPDRTGYAKAHAPAVTVVVSTKDRPRYLPDCLRSLDADLRRDDELVVVQAGNSDAANCLASVAVPWRLVDGNGTARSGQNNRGLLVSTNDVVIFTDDDCRVPRGWRDGMTAALGDPGTGVAFGPVVGLTTLDGAIFPSHRPGPAEGPSWTYAVGASMALRRLAVLEAGGFDERLGPGGRVSAGEDHDLTQRLIRNGWRAAIADAPPVRHLDWRGPHDVRANLLDYERGSGAWLGKALRASPRSTLPILEQRAGHQLALLRNADGRGRGFGLSALRAFVGGLVTGLAMGDRRWL